MDFSNLNDVEFEYLCKDIMSKKLGIELRRFSAGKDGGIDLYNSEKNIVVQVKHFIKTNFSGLLGSLRKELPKVKKLNPNQYYVCCSKELSPQNIEEIYSIFSNYMNSSTNVISLIDINDFLELEENSDILHRHFKLWIESTNILRDILSRDVSIDCESLLYNIKEEEKLFVQTAVFDRAKEILEKKRLLLLLGEPGVGKTLTSKMLVLYFSTKGYRIRYTTDGNDLCSLKKSLSESIETKEIVLLDDCFGQAYYSMKDTQENELLSLIRHIKCYPNKLLIINSRITIFNEAKNRSVDFCKSIKNKDLEISMINMTKMSSLEKAKILYNHLFFSELPREYFEKIKEDKFYWKIINHPNYNPRIIEHFTTKYNADRIKVHDYQEFILGCLSNPQEIWKNEFENRLRACDRLLVYTVYSLTNTSVSFEIVKKCYNRLIKNESEIDFTVDSFESAFSRLQSSFFLKIVDKSGYSEISMLNPSINDFLDSYITQNTIDKIISKGLSVRQFYRLVPQKANKLVLKSFSNNSIFEFCFENEKQKNAYITAIIAKNQFLQKEYKPYISSFLETPVNADLYNKQTEYVSSILLSLISNPLCDYYNIPFIFKDFELLSSLFEHLEFPDLVQFISGIDSFFVENRSHFIELCRCSLEDSLDFYCTDVPADSFDIDVGEVIRQIGCEDEFGLHYDSYGVIEAIEDDIIASLRIEVAGYVSDLSPELIPDIIRNENYKVSVSGVSKLVEAYEQTDYDFEDHFQYSESSSDPDIDYIFQR